MEACLNALFSAGLWKGAREISWFNNFTVSLLLTILLLMRGLGNRGEQSPGLVPNDLHGHALGEVPLRVLQVRVRCAPRQMFQREKMEICPIKRNLLIITHTSSSSAIPHFILDPVFLIDISSFKQRLPLLVRLLRRPAPLHLDPQLLGGRAKEPGVALQHGRLVGSELQINLFVKFVRHKVRGDHFF